MWELPKPSGLLESGRLTDETDKGTLVGHEISLQNGHVAGGLAMDRHPLEPEPLQATVATFG